ncbi:IKI3 family-domain-containing protein [Pyronema domesticum]|nr:IKI3 family-domain-containing protein [Pyronema domesticum]
MRNLLKTEQSSFWVESTTVPDAPISASTWDVAHGQLICAFGPSEGEGLVELSRVSPTEQNVITSWEDPNYGKIISLHYLADSASTCVIFSNGDIVLVREEPTVEVEIVGSIEGGITAAAWSPDEEIIAITTVARNLTLMTREFEPIEEVTFSAEDLKASRHVSVGWGKAETQFQGKHAKAGQHLKDPTVPDHVDTGKLSEQDDGETVITWRGDGAYLAVSTTEDGEKRLIRVYSREGQLDSVSEPVDGFESPLTWRPVGNLIAGIQRLPDKTDVIFFERNGLRHGQFTLRTGEQTPSVDLRVQKMFWNGDSTVLAICLSDRVQLWCMGNYHYYLKQEIMLPSGSSNCDFIWHPERPLEFAITTGANANINKFVWNTATGSNVQPTDYGVVAVADGDKIKITPMRVANVPPPMALCEASLQQTPVDIAVSPSGKRIVALQHTGIDLVSWSYKPISEPVVSSKIATTDGPETYRQACFLDDNTLCLLGDNESGQSVLRCLALDEAGQVERDDFYPYEHIQLDLPCSTLKSTGTAGSVLLQEQCGNVVLYNLEGKTHSPVCKLPGSCPWMESVTLDEQITVFGLSEGGRLYANERMLASSVTSFSVTSAHLIYTTSQHVIKFIHLVSNIHDLEVPSDEVTADERCRNVERGSRLVCVMPSIFAVVLQMPRGNLETIYPRALVLAGVRRSIEKLKYKKAFLACRDNRVDMNLLYDYAPKQLLENIELFVDQLKRIEYIDLFLSQLREEDVTKTMYRETLASTGPQTAETQPATTTKVNDICNAFITILSSKYLSSNIQNIITAYCCKSPPDHEAALTLITSLKGKDLYEQAITHICFLSDVNKLYDTSLGLYDLEKCPPLRRHYSIDDKLGRFSKALVSLHAMGEDTFEETRRYAISKELYSDALRLYSSDKPHMDLIMSDYANHLFSSLRYREAGYAFEYLSQTPQAVESYQQAGMWQEALFAASSLSSAEQRTLATELAEVAMENKDYAAAATIFAEHLSDIPAAVAALCKAHSYPAAMRLAALQQQPDLLASIVDPALSDSFSTLSELISDCQAQLSSQLSRILELRIAAAKDPLAFLDGAVDIDVPDNISLAPTNATTSNSIFTRYTGATMQTAQTGVSRKTSKNRRKDERKRARGKKGSVWEEEYLMNSIRRLSERVTETEQDVGKTVEGGWRRGMGERSAALQRGWRRLREELQNVVEKVWEGERLVVGEGGELVKVEKPVVKGEWEGLSLV